MSWGDDVLKRLKARGVFKFHDPPTPKKRRGTLIERCRVQPRELTKPLVLVVLGRPTTKKTSNRVVRVGKERMTKVLPSKRYAAWEQRVTPQLRQQIAGCAPIGNCIHIRALIYRASNTTGDLNGYQQAIGDALQTAHVIENDRQIVSWDGSRRLIDRKNPRVELTIEPQFGDR